jgi:hypothetical protein
LVNILADNNILSCVKALMETRKIPESFRVASLAQLIELIVLADCIFVDEMSMNISGTKDFFSFLNPEYAKVFEGISISGDDRAAAVSYAQDISRKISFQFDSKWDELHQLRSYFYYFLSSQHNLPYCPGEQRALFLSPIECANENPAIFRRIFKAYEKLRYDAFLDLHDKGILCSRYKRLQYPPIFLYVLERSSSLHDIFNVALDLRFQNNSISFRKWCSEFTKAEQNGDYGNAKKLFDEVDSYLKKICGTKTSNFPIGLQLSFPPAIIFSDVKPLLKRKKHLLFLKEVLSTAFSEELYKEFSNWLKL